MNCGTVACTLGSTMAIFNSILLQYHGIQQHSTAGIFLEPDLSDKKKINKLGGKKLKELLKDTNKITVFKE